jgi:AraC-like DNA-binding protein
MKKNRIDTYNTIKRFENINDFVHIVHESYDDRQFYVAEKCVTKSSNYLSPNRRDFYKILFIKEGECEFSLGLNTYHIDKPALIFIHPSDIISKRNISDELSGYFCVFKRTFMENSPSLKIVINGLNVFSDKQKCMTLLDVENMQTVIHIFEKMKEEENLARTISHGMIEAYLQQLILICSQIQNLPRSIVISEEFRYIYSFFNMLEEEMAKANYGNTLDNKTAKDFSSKLDLHPNYLNSLIKKYTGENINVVIRRRILQEMKIILSTTNWSIDELSYIFGFSNQSNFSNFFKKNTKYTPTNFRKSNKAPRLEARDV